jgi:exodeoxyribonuclease VII large subunit
MCWWWFAATFDDERIARTIAACPLPVFTGVGHEIDRAIADEVAHTAFKTPTACAAHLVERVRAHAADVDEVFARIMRLGTEHVACADREVRERAVRAVDRSRRGLVVADQRVVHQADRIGRQASQALVLQAADLQRTSVRISGSTRAHLQAAQRHLQLDAARLVRRAPRLPFEADRSMNALAARVDALDPVRTLARGWSITRRADGTLVRDAADLHPGDALVTTLASGEVTSKVEE